MKIFVWFLTIIVLAVTIFATGCSSRITISPSYSSVRYEVSGSAYRADITLNNDTGGTEQYSDVRLPTSYYFPIFEDSFLYISAQNQGEYGTVTVKIYVNNQLFKTSTSSGAYVIATASGLLP